MKKVVILHIILSALRTSESVELDYNEITYVTINEPAFLQCALTTPQTIKELWWYKLGDHDETVYYYEPASSTDYAAMKRANRSHNTSLTISSSNLNDEGMYKCRVVVWNTVDNTTESSVPNLPVSKEAVMRLLIDVPPERVEVTHLTSGKNLSLRCTSVGSKPRADISWMKTSLDGMETKINVIQTNTEVTRVGKLYDTSERLFYTLKEGEPIARISCVVDHPSTETILFKNITFISPALQNAVKIAMEKFADPVIYSEYENQDTDVEGAGLVKITAEPGFKVVYNTSLTLKVSAPGVFPEPRYLWWSGDQTGISGSELYIANLQEDETFYVLVENTLGRVVLSVKVYATNEIDYNTSGVNGSDTSGNQSTSQAGLDGGIVAAIVVSSLLAVFLIGFAVWYFFIRDQDHRLHSKQKQNSYVPEESIPFRPSDKPLMRTTSTQTLEGRRSRREPSWRESASAEDILNQALPPPPRNRTPPPGYASKDRRQSEYDENVSHHTADSSSDGNLRSAHEGESGSERSFVSSDVGHIDGHVGIV